MKDLPLPETYEKEFTYMPWGILVGQVLTIIEQETPQNGSVLDLMCGPGYLLGKIAERRPDLHLRGVDISKDFIDHARTQYPHIDFDLADVLQWQPSQQYDTLLCTGGIHHLLYDQQVPFLQRTPSFLTRQGIALFADPYIDDYESEYERKQAAAKLGYAYLVATLLNGAPSGVVRAAIDILYNDVLGDEYKTSVAKMKPVLQDVFSDIKVKKMWPTELSQYGDYLFICRTS